MSTVLGRSAAAFVGATMALAAMPFVASADPGGTPLPSKPVPALASPALAYQTVACDPRGTTSLDAALATSLNSQLRSDMRGYMNAYRTSCARMIINAAKARGLAQRAAVIAVTTAIVETHLQNISEEVDHTSLGLFQQQEWWGSRAQRLNATWATNKFLSVMESKYPNKSWMTAPIGEVCQAVQVSAYPDRYQVQAGDAQIIVNALWNGAGSAAPALMRDDGDGTMTLWRWSSSGSSFSLEGDLFESGGWTMSRVGDRVAAGDVDGDGRDDVVATYQESDGSFSFRVWKGGVSHERWYSSGPFNLDPVGGRLVVGDFNGDGKAEPALMRDDGDGTMTIWRWLSSGSSFERASDYESGGWTMSRVGDRVAAGDVNGDGKDDIVATYQESDGSFSYRVWKGGLSHERWYSSGPFNLDPVGGRLVVGDFNGDGKAEPAMMRDDGDRTMTIWRWVSSGSSFERASDYESGGWTMSQVEDRVAAGDVNGDGKDDIVAAYQNAAGDFTYHVWKNAWTHGEWYTSGQYSLGPVDSRMILGRW
ncbi:hypothetical protein F4558_003201 [Micromonospora profundi]|uniref:FG-GAP repeat domain-containing protein n=1 Tax=Micromonospora profundi TaxID=1420889 RepID=UPI00143BAF92|nr:VCBS repeat-containing protein [Micromonospora profundi]NJC13375.1 hypothetical protein [Micromonospora profundi]